MNILAIAIGPPPDPEPEPDEESALEAWEAWAERDGQRVKLWDGSSDHVDAWDLHQAFKREFVATMPRGGVSGGPSQPPVVPKAHGPGQPRLGADDS